ncbi:hypothetical protein MRX96_054362 [Rhipicephalus microplus]
MQKDTERSRQALPLHGMQAAANPSPGMPPDYHFSPHVAPQRPVHATTSAPIYDQRPPPAAPRQRPGYPVYANAPPKPLRHGATSPNVAEGGGYDACNSYEGYDFYGAQEPLPAYAGRPVSAHYGDNVPNSTMTSTQLMRPRSADFWSVTTTVKTGSCTSARRVRRPLQLSPAQSPAWLITTGKTRTKLMTGGSSNSSINSGGLALWRQWHRLVCFTTSRSWEECRLARHQVHVEVRHKARRQFTRNSL